MSRYILNRAGQALLALFVVTILVFSMVHLSGDPLQVLVPDEAPPEIYEEFRQLLHLDEPIPIQYLRWMGGVLTGDFGKSTTKRVPVSQLIGERLPATLQLAGAGFVFMLAIGLSVGVYAAAFRGSAFDTLARSFAVLGQALPSFWLGLVADSYFCDLVGRLSCWRQIGVELRGSTRIRSWLVSGGRRYEIDAVKHDRGVGC